MGFKYLGDSTLGVSLTMQTPKPLDTRLVVDTRADLYTIPSKYAYNGMPVVCVADGNIYTLLDKNKISEAVGWKASYESILIITCTEDEYKKWLDNTNEDFTPKDDSLTWLHQDTYYYIYEDSIEDKGLYYVSYQQFEDLTNLVNKRATISALSSLSEKTDKALLDLANVYATLEDIDSTNPESKLSKTLDSYYTKDKVDDIFVTKESLRGEGIEGDDFVFVTLTTYNKDLAELDNYKNLINTDLSSKVDTNSDATLKSISTNGNKLVIDKKVTINNNPLALEEDVPKIVVMDLLEYDSLESKDPDTYYMTHGTELDNGGMITSDFLELNYYNLRQVIELLKSTILLLCSDNNLQYNSITIEVEKPTNLEFEYDELIHTLESNENYTVSGEGGSEPGTYRFKVTLRGGKWWSDGTNTPIFVTYTIKDKFSKFGDSFPIKFS